MLVNLRSQNSKYASAGLHKGCSFRINGCDVVNGFAEKESL